MVLLEVVKVVEEGNRNIITRCRVSLLPASLTMARPNFAVLQTMGRKSAGTPHFLPSTYFTLDSIRSKHDKHNGNEKHLRKTKNVTVRATVLLHCPQCFANREKFGSSLKSPPFDLQSMFPI